MLALALGTPFVSAAEVGSDGGHRHGTKFWTSPSCDEGGTDFIFTLQVAPEGFVLGEVDLTLDFLKQGLDCENEAWDYDDPLSLTVGWKLKEESVDYEGSRLTGRFYTDWRMPEILQAHQDRFIVMRYGEISMGCTQLADVSEEKSPKSCKTKSQKSSKESKSKSAKRMLSAESESTNKLQTVDSWDRI
jgi:hypothetical protein